LIVSKVKNSFLYFFQAVSLVMVLVLLAPTMIHVFVSFQPEGSFELLIENSTEEEREEERSSGEDESKEIKGYTLPLEISHRDDFGSLAARKHAYELGAYSTDFPIPYLPPELVA